MKNSKIRFSGTVKNYNKYRPSYPKELINWIIAKTKIKKSDNVVDIGCGTGISTRLFAKKGFNVYGIDPNEDMLEDARKRNGSAIYKKGDAENTHLPKNFANLIISSQVFHWFAIENTMKEFKRILKPGGFCAAFWNVRKKTPLTKSYEAILKKYSGDFEKVTKAVATIETIKKNSSVKLALEGKFTNTQKFDLKGLTGRAYSTSYVVHGVKDHETFKNKLTELFEEYQSGGKVTFTYDVLAICWQF